MSCFIISGGRPLFGKIRAGGSKNAALPIIFATLATRGVSRLVNVPDILDVDVALSIVSSLGAKVSRVGTCVTVDTSELDCDARPDPELLGRIRASTYLLASSLARFGKTPLLSSGGCAFESRPIDLHLMAFSAMGAKAQDGMLTLSSPRDSRIVFPKVSVGATANALILASSIPRVTELVGYAKEPHVYSLIDYLRSAGALIEEKDGVISIKGASLAGADAEIPPDPIETGTFMLLSLMTDGAVSAVGSDPVELGGLLDPLTLGGARLKLDGDAIRLVGGLRSPLSVTAAPYPALPTDLQPPLAVALAAFFGGSVTDTVFPGRFGYLDELARFGIASDRAYGRATVYPSRFRHAEARAPDLRGGIALVLAALFAHGESLVDSSETVRRGYSDIVKKLRDIGADIYELN